MILETLIAAQLISTNSELKKQSQLQNKWANNAIETLLLSSLVNTFVWPFKFGALVWRESSKIASVIYFTMLTLAVMLLPVLTFFVLYSISIFLFFIERSQIEQLERGKVASKKSLPPPKTHSTGKKRTVLEVDAETGEIIRTYESSS